MVPTYSQISDPPTAKISGLKGGLQQGRSDAKNPRGENKILENPRGAKPKKSSFLGFFG